MILKSLTEKISLDMSTGDSQLVYEIPGGTDWLSIQLDAESFTAGTISVQLGLTKAKQYALDTPVAYTSTGLKSLITCTGARYVRLYVSTPSGTDVVCPTIEAGRDDE